MEGEVLRGGGDEVSILSVVYPRGTVSVSTLGYLHLLVLLLNLLIFTFLSHLEHPIINIALIRIE